MDRLLGGYLFPPWFVGSLVYQAALAPVGLNLVASDFHAENKQRKQNRDNMALLGCSTRFGFSVQLLDLSVCKWICMSLKGFHYQVSILGLHRMATVLNHLFSSRTQIHR